jgi:hypothetical protein
MGLTSLQNLNHDSTTGYKTAAQDMQQSINNKYFIKRQTTTIPKTTNTLND